MRGNNYVIIGGSSGIGLALVKKYASANTKVIGILTKPDLMNKDSQVYRN